MSNEDLTPEEFANDQGLTLESTEFVAGMEVAVYTDEAGETLYTMIYPDGTVDEETLSDVWMSGNYTLGRTRNGDREVMLDDDGVHRDW